MGMFDNISVSDKLPFNDEMVKLGLDKNVYSFQSKDLHCSLDTYFIQGGKLLEQKYKETTWIEKKDDLFGGYLDKQEPYLVDTQYHGTLNFYHIQAVDNLDCWMEYNAVFTNGVMEKVELVKFKTTDNTESRKRIEAIFEEAKVRRNKWYNKYIFDTSPWIKFRKLVCKVLSKVERLLADTRMHFP
jgi:hypothetical protein